MEKVVSLCFQNVVGVVRRTHTILANEPKAPIGYTGCPLRFSAIPRLPDIAWRECEYLMRCIRRLYLFKRNKLAFKTTAKLTQSI